MKCLNYSDDVFLKSCFMKVFVYCEFSFLLQKEFIYLLFYEYFSLSDIVKVSRTVTEVGLALKGGERPLSRIWAPRLRRRALGGHTRALEWRSPPSRFKMPLLYTFVGFRTHRNGQLEFIVARFEILLAARTPNNCFDILSITRTSLRVLLRRW